MPRSMVVDSDSEDEDVVGASSSSTTAARGEHGGLEPMDIETRPRSGTKRKQPIDDYDGEIEVEVEEEEEGGREEDEAGGILMQASLDDALNSAKVPDDLRPTIIANVNSFNTLFESGDKSKAAEMMRLVNDTR